MTEQEWIVSEDPAAMLGYLTDIFTSGSPPHFSRQSNRKLRLFACACCHTRGLTNTDKWEVYGYLREDRVLLLHLYSPRHPYSGERNLTDFEWAQAFCGYEADDPIRFPPSNQQMAVLLRDIFGNPFRPKTICGTLGRIVQDLVMFTGYVGAIAESSRKFVGQN